MKTDDRYQLLRNEIEKALASSQHGGVPFGKAMADLIRLALVLAVATEGPARTEALIMRQLEHMRRSFPDLWQGNA